MANMISVWVLIIFDYDATTPASTSNVIGAEPFPVNNVISSAVIDVIFSAIIDARSSVIM